MEELNLLQRISIWLLPVLFAITVHEVAHGWMALRLGDPTAKMMGRLTLNPLKHVDPVGTILVPGLMLFASPFIFGWARPVPVTWENLKRPKRDMALVAVAGPLANLAMAILWCVAIRLGIAFYEQLNWAGIYLIYSGVAGLFINGILMVLNLLPLPPLDGGRIAYGLLPGPWAWRLGRLEPYGFVILLALLFTGLLGNLLSPVLSWHLSLMAIISGLEPQVLQAVLFALIGR